MLYTAWIRNKIDFVNKIQYASLKVSYYFHGPNKFVADRQIAYLGNTFSTEEKHSQHFDFPVHGLVYKQVDGQYVSLCHKFRFVAEPRREKFYVKPAQGRRNFYHLSDYYE